jgi:hypothetical protein
MLSHSILAGIAARNFIISRILEKTIPMERHVANYALKLHIFVDFRRNATAVIPAVQPATGVTIPSFCLAIPAVHSMYISSPCPSISLQPGGADEILDIIGSQEADRVFSREETQSHQTVPQVRQE